MAGLILVLVAANDMAWAGTIESGRDEGFPISGIELVSGHLFAHESVEGLVRVEGMHYVVAEAPPVFAVAVAFEAVRIGKAHYIEPFLGPALAVVRGRKERVDQAVVRPRRPVLQECPCLLRRRRQPSEVEADTSEQTMPVNRSRRFQPVRRQSPANERIDWVRAPPGQIDRRSRVLEWLK